MSGIPIIEEKCIGAFIASAIGDALGWPNELRSNNVDKNEKPLSNFIEWQRRSGGRYWNHTEKILAGEYSDDTQMNLMVARSLLSGKPWVNHLTSVELPFWIEYERGGGGAVKRAAASWKKKIEPWHEKDAKSYFDAGGNGAAMRVLPHVIFGIRQANFESIADEVGRDAILTHGHPRAIVGALCYAYALHYLIKKEHTLTFGELVNAVIDKKSEWGQIPAIISGEWLDIANRNFAHCELWNDIVVSTTNALSVASTAIKKGALDSEKETLAALSCFDKKVNGAGDIAAVVAIYLASKYANNPILGIKTAANAVGSDTDTIASMTGGLLGAICGLNWIPAEWKLVQDYDCLVRISGFLFSESGIEATKEFIASNKLENDGKLERCPIGQFKKVASYELPCGKTGSVNISKCVTLLGQTLYVKKFTREKMLKDNNTIAIEPSYNKYSLQIKPSQLYSLKNDLELSNITFFAALRIYEMFNQGITDIDIIAFKTQMNVSVVKKVASLLVSN